MFCEAPIFKTVGELPGKYPQLNAILVKLHAITVSVIL